MQSAGAGLSVLGFVGLEAALVGVPALLVRRYLGVGLADLAVDPGRRLELHGVGDVGVEVQSGGRRDVADDSSFVSTTHYHTSLIVNSPLYFISRMYEPMHHRTATSERK